jgi:hypothetical protein
MNKFVKRVLLLIIAIVCVLFLFFLKDYLNNNNNISPVVHLDEPASDDTLYMDNINNDNVSPMMRLAQSVPGIKLNMDNLSADQLMVIDKVQERADQYGGGSIKGKIVTEIWQIFNEENRYKVVLTAPADEVVRYKLPVYYDVSDGKIIGNVSSTGHSSIIGENIFTSREQNQFIKDCYSQINKQNKLIDGYDSEEKNIIDDETISFTFKQRTKCMCEAIGCCDNFKSITTEYNFICHLNLDNSVTLEPAPIKQY